MAGLIKGQILKHLSRFVVNLSPSQISLSALRGEGELTGLELNCAVLSDLLELPAWVRLTQATCNRAAIRIQWTKLKTVPIQLSLDEIRVRVETCEELRAGVGGTAGAALAMPQGQYGFTDKVVDGIYVSVNLVHVTLTSLAFTASFQMSRITVESRSPGWQAASLPHTRLKDLERGEVLLFKELSWQTVRIEARSTVATDLTPLRLITNQARVRITLKKRMADCAILGVRLVTILDDLLWVLTDDQLKAALHFVSSVSGLVKKSTECTQSVKAARKLERGTEGGRRPSQAISTVSRSFAKYDVIETSYHLVTDRIDLHFCDDPGGGRSDHPDLQGGGAFQVSLARLQVDHYPLHLARGDRRHWVRYPEQSHPRQWLQANLASFDTRLLDALLAGQGKTPLSRAGRGAMPGPARSETTEEEGLRDQVVGQLSRLMTSNVVVRLGDLTLWRVSAGSPGGRAVQPSQLLAGDGARLHLPPDLPLLHLELSQFYYPAQLDFPLPPPCLLATLNPVSIHLDVLTLLWLNAFGQNLQRCVGELQQTLELGQPEAGQVPGYADVRLEVVMPRLTVEPRGSTRPTGNPWRPTSLQLCASRLSLANYRSLETGSRADLAAVLDRFQQAPMFFGGSFPSRPADPGLVSPKFWAHATGEDGVAGGQGGPGLTTPGQLGRTGLWTEARDVWHCNIPSAWAEFLVPGWPRPVPLLDACPLSVWLHSRPRPPVGKTLRHQALSDFYCGAEKEAGLEALVAASQLLSLQLDHHQLLFLLRLAESLAELGTFLSADSVRIVAPAQPPGTVVAAVLPQLDLSLVLPAGAATHSPLPEPTVKLQVQPTLSTELKEPGPTPRPGPVPQPQPGPGLQEAAGRPGGSPELEFDTLSIRSDESGESGWQSVLSDHQDLAEALFRVERPGEEVDRGPSPAEEVLEAGQLDTSSLEQEEAVHQERRVSVLSLRLASLALAQIAGPAESSLLVEASTLDTNLAVQQEYSQFQFRFGQSSKVWAERGSGPGPGVSAVRLRLDNEPPSSPAAALASLAHLDISLAEKVTRLSDGRLELHLAGLHLAFLSSTLTSLAQWAQDEILPSPLPATVHLVNVRLAITDDGPVPLGYPQPPPLLLSLPNLDLSRDKEGVVSVVSGRNACSDPSERAEAADNSEERLRTQLEAAGSEIRVLKTKLAEKEAEKEAEDNRFRGLQMKLNQLTEQMEDMSVEKKGLLETLKYLQGELLKSGKK